MKKRLLISILLLVPTLAVTMLGAQYWLQSKLEQESEAILEALSQRLEHQINVGDIRLGWSFVQPVLKFRDAIVYEKDHEQPSMMINYVEVKLDWLQLIINKRVSIAKLKLEQPKFILHCASLMSCNLSETQKAPSINDVDLNEFFGLLARQNNLQVIGGEIHIQAPNQVELPLTNVQFSYHHTHKHYHMKGSATLQGTDPAYFQFNVQTDGDLKAWETNPYTFQLSTKNVPFAKLKSLLPESLPVEAKRIKSVDLKGIWQQGVKKLSLHSELKALNLPKAGYSFPEIEFYASYQQEANALRLKLNDFKIENHRREMHVDKVQALMHPIFNNNKLETLLIDNWKVTLPTGVVYGDGQLNLADEPFSLKLFGNLEHLHFLDLKTVLPYEIFKPKLTEWLDESLLNGHLKETTLKCEAGHCSLGFDFADLELDYAPTWPMLHKTHGHLEMVDKKIVVQASGAANGVQIDDLTVAYDFSIEEPEIQVNGYLAGAASKHEQLVEAMPLEHIHEVIHMLKPKGDVTLGIELKAPLKEIKDNVQLTGKLELQDVQLSLPEKAGVLEAVNGNLAFTENSFTSQDLVFQVLKEPATAKLEFDKRNSPQLNIQWQSMFETSKFNGIEGRTAYTGELNGWLQPKTPMKWNLKFSTDLKGIQVALPPPLSKEKDSRLPLEVVLKPNHNGGQSITASIPNLLNAKLRTKKNKLSSANIAFGHKKATYQDEKEILVTGNLAKLDVSAWMDWKNKQPQEESELPLRLDLDVAQLKLSTMIFADMNVKFHGGAKRFNLSGPHLAGMVDLPTETDNTLTINLDKLVLTQEKGQKKKPSLEDFKDLAIHFNCKDFNLNRYRYGEVGFKFLPVSQGHGIHDFRVQGPDYQVTGGGLWDHKQDNTQLSLKVASQDVGKTIKQMGYKASIAHGKGEMQVTLGWPGSPLGLEAEMLDGKVEVNLKEGEIIGINPGIGKLLSLLSIDSLQRRLQLNFDDLVKEGLYFDIFKTELEFGERKAQTEQVLIDGPTARIEIQGQLALNTNQLDGIMLVTPKIGSSIPVAAALAMGNPAIGAAFWLFDQATGSKVTELAKYKYKVSGTWEHPKLIEIVEEKEKRRT